MKQLIQGFIVCGLVVFMGGLASGQTLSEKEMDAEYEKSEEAYKNKNWQRVLEIVKPIAEQGHAKSQRRLGALYMYGLGVEKNPSEGVKWFRLSANQGDAKAQFNLGRAFAGGLGIPSDDKEALKWIQLAANQGLEVAKKVLLDIQSQYAKYVSNSNANKDPSNSNANDEKWVCHPPTFAAARKGNANAAFAVAKWYLFGHEPCFREPYVDSASAGSYYKLKKDQAEGIKWIRKAAELGHPIAQAEVKRKEKQKEDQAKTKALAATTPTGYGCLGTLKQKIRPKKTHSIIYIEVRKHGKEGEFRSCLTSTGYNYTWGFGISYDPPNNSPYFGKPLCFKNCLGAPIPRYDDGWIKCGELSVHRGNLEWLSDKRRSMLQARWGGSSPRVEGELHVCPKGGMTNGKCTLPVRQQDDVMFGKGVVFENHKDFVALPISLLAPWVSPSPRKFCKKKGQGEPYNCYYEHNLIKTYSRDDTDQKFDILKVVRKVNICEPPVGAAEF